MTVADLDAATDPQVAALLTLGRGAVNAELAESLGGDAILGAYPFPATLTVMPAVQLPALMIWRRTEEISRKGRRLADADREVELRVEYVLPATPKDKLPLRWPFLQAVWWTLLQQLYRGHHEAVGGDAEILRAAGIHTIDVGAARVTYSFAAERESPELFPYFQATLPMVYRPPPDLSALWPLLAVYGELRLAGEDPAHPEAEQPVVAQAIPMHDSIVDPDDDDSTEVP